jgi:MFS family permease
METRPVPPDPASPAGCPVDPASTLSPADVRHNVRVNVAMSAIFQIGGAEMALASGPLLVYLGASNTLIGLINGFGWLALFGVFVSPFISRHCPQKKWYMFWSHVPYIGAWGLIGAAAVLSGVLGLDNPALLAIIIGLSAANMFFSGFVTLPSQEFLASCIPMSHRGRYTGFSMSVGSAGAFVSSALGGLILLYLAKPMSFGWLYLIFWILAQGACFVALLAREPRVPPAVAPPPWSRRMFAALREDKRFQRVLVSNLLFFSVLFPCTVFVPIYGYKVLGMPAAAAAVIAIVQQVARILLSSHIGIWTDRFGAKRIAPLWFLLAALSVVPLLVWPSPEALYVTVALQAVSHAGILSAYNPLLLGTPKPENRPGHFSVQIILRNLLDSAGTLLTGLLIDRISFLPFFGGWALLALVLSVVAWRLLAPLSAEARAYT